MNNKVNRECTVCHRVLPLLEFPQRSDYPKRRRTRCHDCQSLYMKEWHKAHPGAAIEYSNNPSGKYHNYKANSKIRKIKFSLTKTEFSNFWQKPCTYCGEKIERIGLDRVDNIRGYSMDNVVSCCEYCNWIKREKSLEEFKQHITRIYSFLNLNKDT